MGSNWHVNFFLKKKMKFKSVERQKLKKKDKSNKFNYNPFYFYFLSSFKNFTDSTLDTCMNVKNIVI